MKQNKTAKVQYLATQSTCKKLLNGISYSEVQENKTKSIFIDLASQTKDWQQVENGQTIDRQKIDNRWTIDSPAYWLVCTDLKSVP